MNIKNILIATLASLSSLQSYSMIEPHKGKRTSETNLVSPTPTKKPRTEHQQHTTVETLINGSFTPTNKEPKTDNLPNKKYLEIKDNFFNDQNDQFLNLLNNNTARNFKKHERLRLCLQITKLQLFGLDLLDLVYEDICAPKNKCALNDLKNLKANFPELLESLALSNKICAHLKVLNSNSQFLKLFNVLPDLHFPQAVFTDIPYTKKNIQRPNLDEIIATLINTEQEKVSICCYHLLSDPIKKALIQQQKQGISIEIITDQKQGNKDCHYKTVKELINNKISVLAPQNDKYEQMHHKFFIFKRNISNKPIMATGSYNPTPHGNNSSWDDLTIEQDGRLIAQYLQRFNTAKKRSTPVVIMENK